MGACELRAQISASTRAANSSDALLALDLPVHISMRMLDPDASRLFENGWIELDAQISIKL
jgi:hypothetical protein